MVASRSFWPCTFHTESPSITFSAFELLADALGGRDVNGYVVEALMKRLAKARDRALLKRVTFDSEQGMFCAFSSDLDALHAIAALLREATGETEATAGPEGEGARQATFDPAIAEDLLVRGFVTGLDADAQRAFLAIVPPPRLAPAERARIDVLGGAAAAAVRFKAARAINLTACRGCRSWDGYLGDPRVILTLLEMLDAERDSKVELELVRVMTRVAGRHLPDRRMASRFVARLAHKSADMRAEALGGLTALHTWDWALVVRAFNDKSSKVRECALNAASCGGEATRFPTWLFAREVPNTQPRLPDAYLERLVVALRDASPRARRFASFAVRSIAGLGDGAAIERAIALIEERLNGEVDVEVRGHLEFDIAVLRGDAEDWQWCRPRGWRSLAAVRKSG